MSEQDSPSRTSTSRRFLEMFWFRIFSALHKKLGLSCCFASHSHALTIALARSCCSALSASFSVCSPMHRRCCCRRSSAFARQGLCRSWRSPIALRTVFCPRRRRLHAPEGSAHWPMVRQLCHQMPPSPVVASPRQSPAPVSRAEWSQRSCE